MFQVLVREHAFASEQLEIHRRTIASVPQIGHVLEVLELVLTDLQERFDQLLERAALVLQAVAKHEVLAPHHLQIALHRLADHFDFAVGELVERVHDQVAVVSAEVVNEHWNLKHHAPSLVAQVVGRAEKVARYVIVIADFAPVVVTVIERPFLVVADAALSRPIVSQVLIGRQSPHSAVRFEVLHAQPLPLDELFEKSFECILTGVHEPEIVEAGVRRTQDSSGRAASVPLVQKCVSRALIDWFEHRFEISVNHEWRARLVFVVFELD